MHKKLLNFARLGVVLRPRGPILVKSGLETPDPTRPSMEFVRTRHPSWGDSVYLPGTSLKGAVRSHAERTLQGLGVKVCDLFDSRKSPVDGGRCRGPSRANGGDPVPSAQVFRHQCPACRTFGSLSVSGRAQLLDALPWTAETGNVEDGESEIFTEANATETRWQVGIDRQSGQAQGGALFDIEVAVRGAFHTEVQLRNFELWQLGLIAAVLNDMNNGDVPIGFGKSRGLGQVSVEVTDLRAEMARHGADRLCGVGALCSDEEHRAYGLRPSADTIALTGIAGQTTWRGTRFSIEGAAVEALLGKVIEGPLSTFIDEWRNRPLAGGG